MPQYDVVDHFNLAGCWERLQSRFKQLSIENGGSLLAILLMGVFLIVTQIIAVALSCAFVTQIRIYQEVGRINEKRLGIRD